MDRLPIASSTSNIDILTSYCLATLSKDLRVTESLVKAFRINFLRIAAYKSGAKDRYFVPRALLS